MHSDQQIDWCLTQLAFYECSSERDPVTNSVRRLAYDLFYAQEKGDISHRQIAGIAKHLSDEAIIARAERFATAHQNETPWKILVEEALPPLANLSFDEARKKVERTRAGVVFTAHPTFAMSAALRTAVAAYASAASDDERADTLKKIQAMPHAPDAQMSLSDEHDAAQASILRAQYALRAITREIFIWARARFPEQWTALTPAPLSLATWVGYDLDGRTDIHWGETFRIRLEEKAMQLDQYAATLKSIEITTLNQKRDQIADQLAAAATFASEQAVMFRGDLDDPEIVTSAANTLTQNDPRRLVSLEPTINAIIELIENIDHDDTRLELCVLRAEMKNYGLGLGRIHLRINAAQVRSALRADLGIDQARGFIDRTTLKTAAQKAAAASRRRINTASIFLEQMTARRQLMLCAQFLKHIDADTPIRFLIAECEAPATVMGAIYLARAYGVDHRLDISPLFETPEAIERGGRFMERLLAENEFVDYIRARGRIAVQIGFSDSGRYMGQVAANLAIERLQILIARALAEQDIRDVEVVVFNTHGESIGRGGFPGTLSDRFNYLMSPWARSRYDHEKLHLNAESSFQGGDGFLHFETDQLAGATIAALMRWSFTAPEADYDDRFYSDINYSWDFYRSVKTWQEALFENQDYHVAIGAFAPSLLFTTGSRKVRRQSGGVITGPRSLRAIPHNAILQQLAAPAHIFGGFGSAAGGEADRIIDHIRGSDRMKEVLEIAQEARRMTSLPALRAYAALFDANFWISKAAGETDQKTAASCEEIAARLSDLKIPTAINRFANLLAADLAKFDHILREVDGTDTHAKRYEDRRKLHALHALRQSLIMRGFMLAASAPLFSKRHDVSRKTVFDLAFALKFDELADLLDQIFPASLPNTSAFEDIDEESDAMDYEAQGYPEIQTNIIALLREIHLTIREIGVGISHFYDAYG